MDPEQAHRLKEGMAQEWQRHLVDGCLQKGFLSLEQAERLREESIETLLHIVTPEQLRTVIDEAKRSRTGDLHEPDPPEVSACRAIGDRVVGRYVLVEELGRGGMGEVWKSWDSVLERWVALKLLKGTEPDDLPRLLREARLASKVTHPNIAAVYELSIEPPKPYIVLQYIRGRTLERLLLEEGPLPAEKALEYVHKVAMALEAAHRQDILHRDIKPSNIIVDEQDEPHLLDFGIARRISRPGMLTATGIVVGTPTFMSPEQAQGKEDLDARSDVFSLGATLYTLLVGSPPFYHPNIREALNKVVHQEIPRLRNLPFDVEVVLRKSMEKDAALRYPSAGAFGEDIACTLRQEPIHARPPTLWTRFRKMVRRNPRVSIATAAAVLFLVTGIVFGTLWIREGWRRRNRVRLEAELGPVKERLNSLVERVRAGLRVFEQEEETLLDLERTCTAVMKADPQLLTAYFVRGAIRKWRDDLDGAEADYREVTRHRAEDAFAWFSQAGIHLRRYLRRAPAPLFGLFLGGGGRSRLYPPSIDRSTRELRKKFQEDYQRAVDFGLDPGNAAYARAYIEYASARYSEARSLLRKAVEGPIFDPSAYYFIGMCCLMSGEFEPAIEALTQAERFAPRCGSVLAVRAVAHAARADWKTAIKDCTMSLERDPNYEEARLNRATYRTALGEFDAALEDLEKLPLSVEVLINRALIRKRQGDGTSALRDLQTAVSKDPANPLVHAARGFLLAQLDRKAEAAEAFTTSLRCWSDQPEVLAGRAMAKAHLGELEGAILDCDAAIALDGTYAIAYFNRSLIRSMKQDLRGAISDATEALRRDPGLPEVYGNRGTWRTKLIEPASTTAEKELREALEDLQTAIRLKPDLETELDPLVKAVRDLLCTFQ